MIEHQAITRLPGHLDAIAERVVLGTARGVHRLDRSCSLRDGPVTAVVHDRRDVLALVDGHQVWRIGEQTAELSATLDGAHAGCLVTHDGDVWLGGEGAILWRQHGTGFEPVTTFASAPTSDRWHTPWGGPPSTFSLASAGDDLYVNVHVGGILRSDDGGRTWRATIDLDDDVHEVEAHRDGRVWAATGRRGLGLSDDRGDTWQYRDAGLHSNYLLAATPTADGALVAASSGHAARDDAIYRLDGDRFVRCTAGLPDDLGGTVGTGQLAADGDVAVLAAAGGHVYVTVDGGRDWDRIDAALPPVTCVAVLPG